MRAPGTSRSPGTADEPREQVRAPAAALGPVVRDLTAGEQWPAWAVITPVARAIPDRDEGAAALNIRSDVDKTALCRGGKDRS